MVSAEDAARIVKSGDRVVLPCVVIGVTPTMIMACRDELKDVEIQAMAPAFDPGC